MHLRRTVGLVAACATAASPAVLLAAPAHAADAVPLQILSINDFHGHLEPNRGEVGAAKLGGIVDALRAEVPSTSFVSAGDNIGASPFISSSAQDAPTIDALNAMGLDASAVGNHEFDRGYDDLAGRVVPRADFPILGANVEGESPQLPEHRVVTTVDGIRIGYIGVVTEQTASLVAPSGIEGITFTDPVAATNREAAELTDGDEANGEADVVVLLAHEGAAESATTEEECAALYERDDAFGDIVRDVSADVDVVFGGHTHLRVNCRLPVGGDASTLRPVLEAAQYGTALAQVRATFDPATGELSDVQTAVLTLADVEATDDPEVAQIVADAKAASQEIGEEVVGTITTDLTRATTASGDEDRGAESVLGNFIADVQLWAADQEGRPGADIAFMNPGGLRDDLLVEDTFGDEQPGEVTYGELAVVQPFANTLFTLDLTGAEIDAVLEQQFQPEGASRPVLALGVSAGLFFAQDATAPAGERISSITLDGEPLDPAATYRVVTNSFLASGGDGFTALAGGENRTDTGLDDLTALVQYFEANSPVTPDTEPRREIEGRTPQPSAAARPIDDSCPDGQVPAAQFPDVDPESAHAVAVRCTAWYEIARGYADGSFRPLEDVSRAQMAAFVARTVERAGVQLSATPADAFGDDDGTEHELRINQLAAVGIVLGRGDGTYGPDDVVSRAQMTSYLVRAYRVATDGRDLPLGSGYFEDVDGLTQEGDINRVAAVGITAGRTQDSFAPTDGTTRGEMTSFLARLLDVLVEDGHATTPGA